MGTTPVCGCVRGREGGVKKARKVRVWKLSKIFNRQRGEKKGKKGEKKREKCGKDGRRRRKDNTGKK